MFITVLRIQVIKILNLSYNFNSSLRSKGEILQANNDQKMKKMMAKKNLPAQPANYGRGKWNPGCVW
jgi:hypothetical protein